MPLSRIPILVWRFAFHDLIWLEVVRANLDCAIENTKPRRRKSISLAWLTQTVAFEKAHFKTRFWPEVKCGF